MPSPVFVLGAPRSGTTLLRVMLAGHPRLFSPPEMVIAPFATMAERRAKLNERFWEKGGLRRALMEIKGLDVDAAKSLELSLDDRTVPEVYAWLMEALGERILVDKCPHLSAEPSALDRLARWFPDARWVWIVRHPGSVTRSIENMPMAEVMLQGYAPDARSIWYHANRTIQRFLTSVPRDHQVTVRYEDLVTNPRPALERVCTTLGIPFDAALLNPYEGDRMREGPPGARAVGDPNLAGRGKIQPELASSWLEGFDPASVSPETHGLARELGYDLGALPPPPLTRVSSALTAFWEAAKDAESRLIVPNDLDALEGRRFLTRMVSASLDLFVEEGDANHPHFHHAEGPHRKMFADNPDADYLRAPISLRDGRVYRVYGRVPPGTTYVGMLYYGRGGRPANRMSDTSFVRADGTFDVRLAMNVPPDAAPGAWLKGDGDETAVMVRQYFVDRAAQASVELHIEFLGTDPYGAPISPATTLTAEGLTRALERAKRNLEVVLERTNETRKVGQGMALNRFIPVGGEQLFPTPDNSYLVCWYRFGKDQRMFVRGTLPTARYTSFCLYNTWLESLDYQHAQVCLNHAQVKSDAEGRFELCLAHHDPGHPNWLDTCGHDAGYLLVRALLPEGDLPVPTIEVRYEREIAG